MSTDYNPQNSADYQKDKLQANHKGTISTVPHGTSANIDVTMTEVCLLTGIELRCKNHTFGDYVNGQIVVIGAGPGGTDLLLLQFATTWYLSDDPQDQVNENSIYPAKLSSGMTIRMVYTSTGSNDVTAIVNYKLQKVLV